MVKAVILSFILIASTAPFIPWKVKDGAFSVAFKGTRVEGTFKGLKANIEFDPANPAAATISATIDAKSLETGNWLKTMHAKSGLDVDDYPLIKFIATSVSSKGGSYSATGNLTIRDVTRSIVLPFTFTAEAGKESGIFEGKFSIAPRDYHVTKFGTPETMEITLSIPVTKG